MGSRQSSGHGHDAEGDGGVGAAPTPGDHALGRLGDLGRAEGVLDGDRESPLVDRRAGLAPIGVGCSVVAVVATCGGERYEGGEGEKQDGANGSLDRHGGLPWDGQR